MPQKWKKPRLRPRPAKQRDIHRLKSPRQRLKGSLALPLEVARVSEDAVVGMTMPSVKSDLVLVQFDLAMLARGINALKAVQLLCGEGHWEFAASVVRQLFELVINLEFLAEQPRREEAVRRYMRFGLLQTVVQRQAMFEYDRKTGRAVNAGDAATVEAMLEREFSEFRDGKTPGRWKPNWSGQTARQLADRSGHKLRKDQYKILFTVWSEQTHATPGALLNSIFPGAFDPDQIVANDDTKIAETIGVAVTLFLDLHGLLPRIPRLPMDKQRGWIEKLLREAQKYGAVERALPS